MLTLSCENYFLKQVLQHLAGEDDIDLKLINYSL
jgi:hypothetical protein